MDNLVITLPSKDIGFVEHKRSFVVEGDINIPISNNAILSIDIVDENNSIVRHVECDKKYKDMFLDYPDLVKYKDELDPGLVKLKEFGFPLLVVDDINKPMASIHKASIKAWYSDTKFKAVIVNASSVSSGAIAYDGFGLTDDNEQPYSLLKEGKYTVFVKIQDNNNLYETKKDFIIGYRSEQLICRFNPESHKQRMKEWISDKGISMIEDLLPGYLEPYLGKWYYHMGLLTMYRANDLCLFEKAHVTMFDYLIDETSTSYETELGYLQSTNSVNSNRMDVYYYDIGEAFIGRNANILKFDDNQFGHLYRIDKLKNNQDDNYFDRNNVDIFHLDVSSHTEIESDKYFAITGVIKPIQLDPNDFIRKHDNTYEMNDYPYIIRYTFNINGVDHIFDRKPNMERVVDGESIGKSIYEFYNVFKLEKEWGRVEINIKVDCIYKKGKCVPIGNTVIWVH